MLTTTQIVMITVITMSSIKWMRSMEDMSSTIVAIVQTQASKKLQLVEIPTAPAMSSSDKAIAPVAPATPATSTFMSSKSCTNEVAGVLFNGVSQQLPLQAPSPVVVRAASPVVLPLFDFCGALTHAVYNDQLMHSFELNSLQRSQQLGTLLSL